jgi:hypothetical protein
MRDSSLLYGEQTCQVSSKLHVLYLLLQVLGNQIFSFLAIVAVGRDTLEHMQLVFSIDLGRYRPGLIFALMPA